MTENDSITISSARETRCYVELAEGKQLRTTYNLFDAPLEPAAKKFDGYLWIEAIRINQKKPNE